MNLTNSAEQKFAELKREVEALLETMNEAQAPVVVPTGPINNAISPANPFDVFRYFYDGVGLHSYSTWFPLWGGIAGAAHSSDGLEGTRPPFATGSELYRPDGLDAVLYGATLPQVPPRQLQRGDRVRLYGYPAASQHIAVRTGHVHLQRDDKASWVIAFDDGVEPVTGGMSGGAMTVVNSTTGRETLAGILVVQNHRADLDADGDNEHSADVVSLRDIHDAANGIG